MTNQILPTNNETWGFYGTADRFGRNVDTDKAWALAFRAIRAATMASDEGIRFFLDSRHGRHFADDVSNELARGNTIKKAIDAAVTRWMGWTISYRTSRKTGIPKGLPHLTGFVANAEIEAEIEA